MAVAQQKTVRIVAESGNPSLKRVNVVTQAPTSPARGQGELTSAIQATGPTGNLYPTYQLAPTGTAGLETQYIPGFTAVG